MSQKDDAQGSALVKVGDATYPILSPRWTPLRRHEVQLAYVHSPHRFNVVPAGRRSGKTERAKRKLARKALSAQTPWTPRFFAAAPTRDQAKRIYWDDLKLLIPPHLRLFKPSESELKITCLNGAEIWVVGMDKPERIEGQPWDGGILDEFANMKSHAWAANVRPALSDRLGWCDLIGVPEGRNHYYEIAQMARASMKTAGALSEWGFFTWFSADILPASEIAAAKRDLDPITYEQEYEASFVNFEGRAYYQFDAEVHTAPLIGKYNRRSPLILCFDFNVDPGVCVILQEGVHPIGGHSCTFVIGEVWIERNSNTPAVCRKIIADWGPQGHDHLGAVRCYGDATGGSRGTAKVAGSDWDLIAQELRPVFRDKLTTRLKSANPTERARINAMNTRMRSASGRVSLLVDPKHAKHVVTDLEGVRLLKGGSGEIDKKATPMLTHLSDALGYYVDYEYPIVETRPWRQKIAGT